MIATVTQIADMYWDLVSAYQAEKVMEQSDAFAQQSLDTARKQLQLEAIPAMDVLRAEAEVSKRDQDLTVAKTTLQLQESLVKNALTKNLDDPTLEAMPVIPTDTLDTVQEIPERPTQDLITQALADAAGTCRSPTSISAIARSRAKPLPMRFFPRSTWSAFMAVADWPAI